MSEHTCGKLDRCKYAAKCPHKQRPMVEYLCFERKFTTTAMKKGDKGERNENRTMV